VKYLATINVDDTSTGTLIGNGPFGCDFNAKRPPNPIGGIHWDPRIDRFIVALPNVLNNIPVNQIRASAPTPSGSNILTFASVPSTIAIGQFLVDVTTSGAIPLGTTVIGKTAAGGTTFMFDFTTSGAIPPGTIVVGTTATTVTMSATATGGGVLSGDQIAFAVGDGSGPGQNFVPDGPTGGPQAGQGCYYPQGTPAGANSVGTFFWSCDGGLLVIDPTNVTPDTLNTIGYTASTAGVVLKLGYCSPGSIALTLPWRIPSRAPPHMSGTLPMCSWDARRDSMATQQAPDRQSTLPRTTLSPSM
jgi:hypothetical protein